MKSIWLIRHAKSSWKNMSLRDFDRPLNSRGERDAPFMGQKLYESGLRSIGLVWSRSNIFAHGVPFGFPMSPDLVSGEKY